ncbi:MAG: hypothetical protein IJH12_01740 [Clostridia bacterium]|nr:hypothetical protein [Clostridia bacterium]
MDNNIDWEPQNVANLAEALSKIGNEYRSKIANIYYFFNKIGQDQKWIGKNYNSIVDDIMNKSRNTFEEWANYLQYIVPETIYTIANMQASIGGGTIDFFIYQNSDEIRAVEDTVEKADGSMIINYEEVRKVISNNIASESSAAISKLQEYYMQFEMLGTLNGNEAIIIMYEQLDNLISKNKAILNTFIEEMENSVEMSIRKTEITNTQTILLADKILSILN